MRKIIFVAILMLINASAAAQPVDNSAISAIREELRCQQPPRAGAVFGQLYRDRLIQRSPSKVFDSINVFPLRQTMSIDGLSIVAVFGYDERSDFPFVRAPGTSPGNVFGVVTKDTLYAIDKWRHNSGNSLELDEGNTGIAGGRELSCSK